jgi:hypothetical protein
VSIWLTPSLNILVLLPERRSLTEQLFERLSAADDLGDLFGDGGLAGTVQ